jgi:predicted GNAT family N-acyltransferase
MQASSSIEIRRASPHEVIDLRHEVLRQGLPRAEAINPGDDAETTRHFVAIQDEKVVGCVTLLLNEWQGEVAWQLRGMGVAPALQRSGIGRRLLDTVEASVLSDRPSCVLWCNARTTATDFYEKSGWAVASEVFEIPTAGPHVKMIKRLKAVGGIVR